VNRIKFLDGLRGWAAVFVLLYHVFCESIPFDPDFGERLQSLIPFSGAIAIFIFFLVSGFSLCTPATERRGRGSWAVDTFGSRFPFSLRVQQFI
jgi:peptidoglycan/LPS O-acetylase OafA/YrhL